MAAAPTQRLTFIEPRPSHRPETLAHAVEQGLSAPQKHLPCRFFYDAAGSALFEQICRVPEYYPTRTEQSILARHAPEMLEAAGRNVSLVELGSGSSRKTRILLEALLGRQPAAHYTAIDISRDFLRESAEALLEDYDQLSVTAIAAEYADGIVALPESLEPRLFLFLGSNIGNFEEDDAVAFLAMIRGVMLPSDRVLIGIDLVKDRSILRAAYDDGAGVTAAFNLNLLARINRELDADFSLTCFAHEATFIEERSRIEMRLVSIRPQAAHVGALARTFQLAEGERIHTENSHKYTVEGFTRLCARAGLNVCEKWTDWRQWFAVMLLEPAG